MKKLILLLIVALIVAGGYKKLYTQTIPTQSLQLNKQEQTKFKNYQDEQKRLVMLQKLQNPEYLQGELRKVGKLITLESNYQYSDTITQRGFMDMTLRQMTLDLNFSFGIGVDLQYIKVARVLDKVVVLRIPKERMILEYIQLNQEKSTIKDGKKMIFVSQFKPSDVESVIGQSQANVVNKIGANRKLFDTAMGNLKGQLGDFCKGLGYQKVMFEET